GRAPSGRGGHPAGAAGRTGGGCRPHPGGPGGRRAPGGPAPGCPARAGGARGGRFAARLAPWTGHAVAAADDHGLRRR
ncbi:hypothetical protein EO238_34320, partial [Citrobacter sp. AAK_AS5]